MYEDVNELMMPLLRPLFSDNSWKVRFQIADLFIKVFIQIVDTASQHGDFSFL